MRLKRLWPLLSKQFFPFEYIRDVYNIEYFKANNNQN